MQQTLTNPTARIPQSQAHYNQCCQGSFNTAKQQNAIYLQRVCSFLGQGFIGGLRRFRFASLHRESRLATSCPHTADSSRCHVLQSADLRAPCFEHIRPSSSYQSRMAKCRSQPLRCSLEPPRDLLHPRWTPPGPAIHDNDRSSQRLLSAKCNPHTPAASACRRYFKLDARRPC